MLVCPSAQKFVLRAERWVPGLRPPPPLFLNTLFQQCWHLSPAAGFPRSQQWCESSFYFCGGEKERSSVYICGISLSVSPFLSICVGGGGLEFLIFYVLICIYYSLCLCVRSRPAVKAVPPLGMSLSLCLPHLPPVAFTIVISLKRADSACERSEKRRS